VRSSAKDAKATTFDIRASTLYTAAFEGHLWTSHLVHLRKRLRIRKYG